MQNVISTKQALKLQRLLQLCSANLPVGGFSFSQGLEFATENAWLSDTESTQSWIDINLTESIAQTDLPILKRLYKALLNANMQDFAHWNEHIIACRESRELLLADLAMGKALMRLMTQLDDINIEPYADLLKGNDCSFVSAFTLCAYTFELDLASAQSGFCWTVIDNQVAAATKLVPLGQTQAQNLLFRLSEHVDVLIHKANAVQDADIGNSLVHLAMASAWHESQYSRLFRS